MNSRLKQAECAVLLVIGLGSGGFLAFARNEHQLDADKIAAAAGTSDLSRPRPRACLLRHFCLNPPRTIALTVIRCDVSASARVRPAIATGVSGLPSTFPLFDSSTCAQR